MDHVENEALEREERLDQSCNFDEQGFDPTDVPEHNPFGPKAWEGAGNL